MLGPQDPLCSMLLLSCVGPEDPVDVICDHISGLLSVEDPEIRSENSLVVLDIKEVLVSAQTDGGSNLTLCVAMDSCQTSVSSTVEGDQEKPSSSDLT